MFVNCLIVKFEYWNMLEKVTFAFKVFKFILPLYFHRLNTPENQGLCYKTLDTSEQGAFRATISSLSDTSYMKPNNDKKRLLTSIAARMTSSSLPELPSLQSLIPFSVRYLNEENIRAELVCYAI